MSTEEITADAHTVDASGWTGTRYAVQRDAEGERLMPNQLQALLQQLMDERGLTKSDLARKADLHRNTVHNMLDPGREGVQMRPARATLEKLSGALGVSTDLLMEAAAATAGYRRVERRSNHRARYVLALLDEADDSDFETAVALIETILAKRRANEA